MTTLVLGHLVLDEIHSHDGELYSSPGGITFPLQTFSALSRPEDRILPVFPYGPDAHDVMQGFAKSDGMDASHCWEVESGTTRVRLFHESPSTYNTQLVRSLESIPESRYAHLLPGVQLVYLNLMTGDDITAKTAVGLKGEGRLVYIDLHMIAYRVRQDGHRAPAASEQWKEWMRAGDILQCNEREFDALLGTEESVQQRMNRVFEEAAPEMFVLTRGEEGADLYTAPDSCHHVPAVPPASVVDPTGCGDAFGSTLAHGIAAGDPLTVAAQRAAQAAAFVVTLPGSNGISGLRAHLQQVHA